MTIKIVEISIKNSTENIHLNEPVETQRTLSEFKLEMKLVHLEENWDFSVFTSLVDSVKEDENNMDIIIDWINDMINTNKKIIVEMKQIHNVLNNVGYDIIDISKLE